MAVQEKRSTRLGTAEVSRGRALALLGTAWVMVTLDSTIVLTAVPSMQRDLPFSGTDVQWVVTAYALTFGGLMLLGGRMADLLGRRRVFMGGVALFVLASLGCGLAWSPGSVVTLRAIQGLAAAVMAPTALSLVMSIFPEGPARNRALGVWGGLGGVGAIAGLLVGGLMTAVAGWRWIFFLNIPIGILLFSFSRMVLPRYPRGKGDMDLAGAVAVTVGMLLLVYAVVQVPDTGWSSNQTLGLLTASVASLALFVAIERKAISPLLPLRVLTLRTVVGGNFVILLAGMGLHGVLFPLTLYGQQVRGWSALEFGLVGSAMMVSGIAGAWGAQALVTRTSVRLVASIGMGLIGVGAFTLSSATAQTAGVGWIVAGLAVFGPGLNAAFVSSQISALTGVGEEEAGLASGMVDTSFNLGGALGVAVVTTIAVSGGVSLANGGADLPISGDIAHVGYRSAFNAVVWFALTGLLAASTILRSRKGAR